MNYFILATESGELLLAENGYELAADAFVGTILTDEAGQWLLTEDGRPILINEPTEDYLASELGEYLLTEDGRYILVTAGFAQPVLFIANVGRMMGR